MFLSFFSCCRILIFLTLWLANNGFVLKDIPESKPQNHLKNKDDGDLRVDMDINDDDYNWSEYDLAEQFEELDRISIEKEYDKAKGENVNETRPNVRVSNTETVNSQTTEFVAMSPSLNSIEKRKVTIGTETAHVNGKRYKETKETFHIKTEKPLCGPKTDACDVGIKGIKCLFVDCKEHRQPYCVLVARIWNVALIWLSVYGALAIPFWCFKGWCCCCLCCKFFKPQETIQEAKDYLLLNPPGVLVTKKGAIIHYEPTEREKDCYEEFGHFMRTL